MSITNFVDLCSDDELGEADVKAVKREPDLDPGTIWRKECYRTEQVQHRKSKSSSMGQESEENRSSNALSTGQSSSSILDQGGSPVDVSSLSSASPGCSVTLCRQFWKAGNYDVGQGSKAGLQNGRNHLRVHPKFLHSNATSHKWAFGAIAELLDNAVDEIQNGATFVVVDKTSNPRDGSAALLIQDDGGGMDPEAMRRCLSFGFSDKKSKSAIGQYGNGFKTSSMRLGADVIVFSRHKKKRTLTQSIGLLSYTFLRQTGHDRIVVPMVDYEFNTSNGTLETLLRYGREHFTSNLSILLQWSPYATEAELLKQFDDIGHHGTKVIIYNLWFNDDGDMELDFDSDAEDICINKDPNRVQPGSSRKIVSEQHLANRFHYSLRVYSSILYLRIPQSFRMILRGRVVEYHNIANDLKFPEFIVYRPKIGGNMEAEVVTTIGFLKDAPVVNIHGFNVYHKNRLILPFWRVLNNRTNSQGRGVVGVLEANFIEPTHDKQDFEKTALLQKLESRLKEMTLEYWHYHCGLIGYHQVKKCPPARVLPQKSPVSGTYSCLQQTVTTNYSSPLIDSPRSASAGGAFQDPAATPSYSLAGSPGQPIGDYPYSSQTGLHIKRKNPHHGVEPEVVKRQTGTGAYNCDTKHNWGRQPANGIEKQLQDQEATSLMQENRKLHAQCLGFQKREEELDLKVQQLRGELAEVEREYARLLAESQSMDEIKEENM